MIVQELRQGLTGETSIDWLVSCKHFAHSNNSVTEKHEVNIFERVRRHNCKGFMGVYSTIASAGLASSLAGLEGDMHVRTFDGSEIERLILSRPYDRDRILASYFPLSHERYRGKFADGMMPERIVMQEDLFLDACKTALIILEIDKIKEEYELNIETAKRCGILKKLYKYSDHSNERIADRLFPFLVNLSYETRHDSPEDIALELQSLITSFFPFSFKEDKERKSLIDAGKTCTYIGSNIAYNSFIHTGDFRSAEWGLSILKYIYRYAKQHAVAELTSEVYKVYAFLQETLQRPERNDLGNARGFIEAFKADLENPRLETPNLPVHLRRLVEWRRKS